MAGKLSFSIALNLLTENFKAGTNNVKNGLRSMQMQVLTFAAALGAGGLGLEGFVSRLIETARETSKVTTALKNVSGGAGAFATNQKWLIGLANKYGLEINSLTGAFAKFTATASMAGMSMAEQTKLFEGVSRATTAFGLSSDEANGMFLALSQMMSKGKISAEELRGQMGERLPIAMQAMAKAAGTTVGGLDDLMKQGKLLSSEVLPKFADALNSMTPSVDTDNIETSMNRLKNTFTDFTKNTGIQDKYKKIVDSVTQLIQSGAANMGQIVNASIAVIVGLLGGKLFRWIATELAKAQRSAMYAAARSAKSAGIAFDAVAWKAQSASVSMRTAFTRAGAAIKGAMMSIMPTAIIMGITYLIAELIRTGEEAKRIKAIFSDYKAEAASISHTPEIIQLQVLQGIINDSTKAYSERKSALDTVNGLLGTSYTLEDVLHKKALEFNGTLQDRIGLLRTAAEVDFYTRKKLETEDKIKEVSRKFAAEHKDEKIGGGGKWNPWSGPTGLKTIWQIATIGKGVSGVNAEIVELNAVLSDTNKHLAISLGKAQLGGKTAPPVTLDKDEKKVKETDLQKEEREYKEKLKAYTNAKDNGVINEGEYNKAIDELNAATYKKIAELLNPTQAATNKTFNEAKAGFLKPLSSPTYQLETDFASKKTELSAKKDSGAIGEELYKEELDKLVRETIELTGALLGAGAKQNTFYKELQSQRSVAAPLTLDKRDKTFDYKKSKSEIANDELDVAKANLDKMKEYAKANALDLAEQITASTKNVTSLSDALKIQQVKDDIKDLNEQINRGLYSGVKDVASSADRMVSSFKNLSDVFSDVDSSGWERIMAIWSAMTNAVDGILSILDMIENFTKLTNELAAAKEAEAIVDTAVTGTKVANSAAEATAAGTAAIASSAAVTTAATAAATASTIQMAAESTAAYAAIPFAGVGLAAAQIAAMKGMIAAAALPCFENGGIVGGSSYSGDKILARLNSGEMILNKGQQATMYSLLSNGNGGGSSSTSSETRIRGCDIYLALKNYTKQTGKKL